MAETARDGECLQSVGVNHGSLAQKLLANHGPRGQLTTYCFVLARKQDLVLDACCTVEKKGRDKEMILTASFRLGI